MEISAFLSNISNTAKTVSSDFQTKRSGLKKRRRNRFSSKSQLRGIRKSNETILRVFHIASKTINNYLSRMRDSKQVFTKFYDIQ